MYGQKFNPYGQFPSKDQLYQDQYEEEDSEPLVEEVDDSYEPTDKEVKQYAIETLGMKFPEDQGLLYLAREGLKAPLPPNWVPYQGRDGEVYYKHKITQQKTYDHPTDIEYRKKYEQMKEKAARKNLKSMNMKASAQLGIGNNSNSFVNNASNMMAPKISSSNLFGSSNILSTAIDTPAVKLDSRIEEEFEAELKKLQDRLRRQWKDFESEERFRSQMKQKKIKEDFEQQLENVYKGKKSEQKVEDRIKEEKAKIKQRLDTEISSGIATEVQNFQRNVEQKSRQFAQIYQEDNHIKLSKYQQERDHQFTEKEKKYQQTIIKVNQTKEKKLAEKEAALKKLREELQGGKNKEIEIATADALQEELRKIKDDYANKIKQKEKELEREFAETKRVLGYDQNAYLSELAAKKARLKSISQQKMQSLKKKETQALNLKFQSLFQTSIQKLKQELEYDFSCKLDDEKLRLQTKITRQKEKIDLEYRSKGQSQIQNVYEDMKYKIQGYETEMNKKLTSIQEKFINDIHNKTKGQHPDLVLRLQVKERQMLIDNKNMMIESLKRQMELEKITYQLLKIQSQLSRCKDSHSVDQKLMKYSKQYHLSYRTDKYIKYETSFKEMKEKYKKDKQFLASVMHSLQGNRSLGVGGAATLKQYNQDVRMMRDNDEMLRRYQSLLKRAELNDKNAIEELQSGNIRYIDITMKADMERNQLSMMSSIEQQNNEKKVLKRKISNQPQSKDIETALKDHSHFLSSMRSQLNRKLYQIRSGIHY